MQGRFLWQNGNVDHNSSTVIQARACTDTHTLTHTFTKNTKELSWQKTQVKWKTLQHSLLSCRSFNGNNFLPAHRWNICHVLLVKYWCDYYWDVCMLLLLDLKDVFHTGYLYNHFKCVLHKIVIRWTYYFLWNILRMCCWFVVVIIIIIKN